MPGPNSASLECAARNKVQVSVTTAGSANKPFGFMRPAQEQRIHRLEADQKSRSVVSHALLCHAVPRERLSTGRSGEAAAALARHGHGAEEQRADHYAT